MLRAFIHLHPLPRVFHGLRGTQQQSSSRVLPCRSSWKPLVSLRLLRASFASPSFAGRSPLFGLAPRSPESSNSSGRVRYSSGGGEEGSGKERLVQHLLVGEKEVELLAELQKQIAQGIDLSDLAVEFSICPSKENGGMLGWIRRGQMVPEFEEAAFGAPLNKVVRCKSEFGWHLVQVISEREGSLLRDIGPEELHSKMENPDFFEESQLIDVREPDEVAIASVPGFKVLPLRQFGKWGPDIANDFDPLKDTYVLCHHGVRSLQVAQWLQTQGFRSVFNVAGGIHAYALMADPSIPTY